MPQRLLFFPDEPASASAVWAWVCYAVLLLATLVAAVLDHRTGRIPNSLTLPLFLLGLAMNAVRGGMLAAAGRQVWLWTDPSMGLGILDGLLFSFAGFGLAFALFFLQWILGVCGGGDLKLFAALGAWVGWSWSIMLLIGTVVCVAGIVLIRGAGRVIRGKPIRFQKPPAHAKKGRKPDAAPSGGEGRGKAKVSDTIYAPSMAISVAVLLPWLWRYELGLAQPAEPPGPAAAKAKVVLAR